MCVIHSLSEGIHRLPANVMWEMTNFSSEFWWLFCNCSDATLTCSLHRSCNGLLSSRSFTPSQHYFCPPVCLYVKRHQIAHKCQRQILLKAVAWAKVLTCVWGHFTKCGPMTLNRAFTRRLGNVLAFWTPTHHGKLKKFLKKYSSSFLFCDRTEETCLDTALVQGRD